MGIGLVYPIVVILFGSVLVPLVVFSALPLVVIGSFVAFAVTGRALNLSALADLLMPRGIVVTNAVVLLDQSAGSPTQQQLRAQQAGASAAGQQPAGPKGALPPRSSPSGTGPAKPRSTPGIAAISSAALRRTGAT